ncbi:murein biosynthesis integral membrane protein MurJ [Patescibacteria group bacterium]|nr:murein biosynthesis integral membrane protein MurJ [Patescibacteria group bacterium]MBU4453179.1 murein biosynthesis integral membrane protein MurJ [Patescibacteria group bacterium]MCG2687254.1 murein biosynthesis integral membrane protein MurJ [Candidatus Parcubacteria bacterium]
MISWFKNKSESIIGAAAIIASFSILSRVIGFARDRILAGAFGAGDTLDVYFSAFRIPDLLFQLMVVGALSASFIPLFTKYYKDKSDGKEWELTNKILNLIVVTFTLIIILVIIFINPLASAIAPGFDLPKHELLVSMARIMFGAQLILAISMVFGSVLQGAKNFFLFSLAPIFYNVGIIAGVVFFVPVLGEVGLAWGVVFGAFMHLLLQFIGVKALGYSYKPLLVLKDKDITYTIKNMVPRVLGLAVNQVNFILMTAIASTLAVGSITVLQFAYNLNYFAVGVIGVSYAVAVFPTLCSLYNDEKFSQLIEVFSRTTRQMLLFLIPATVFFLFLRAQMVRLVVGAGEFDWEATILTANTLGFFASTLIFQSLVYLLIRMYFAQGNTKSPLVYALISTIVFVLSAILLTQKFGVLGLGMAYSLSSFVQFILLWTSLRIKMGGLKEKQIMHSAWKMVVAGSLCAFSVQGMKYLIGDWLGLETFFGVFAQLAVAGLVGSLVYILSAYALECEEMQSLVKGLKGKFIKQAKPQETIVTSV